MHPCMPFAPGPYLGTWPCYRITLHSLPDSRGCNVLQSSLCAVGCTGCRVGCDQYAACPYGCGVDPVTGAEGVCRRGCNSTTLE